MKKTTFFKRVLPNLLGVLILGTFAQASVTHAAFDPNLKFSTCSLGIYPFNPTGTVVDEFAKQWFNLFEAMGDGTCNAHLKYPEQYSPQPPKVEENPLVNASGVENIHAPKAQHNHTYYNASVEDDFFYRSQMDRFEITLEADALSNTNLDQIVCVTPRAKNDVYNDPNSFVETPGCNGFIPDEWGGTNISFNKSTGVIQWKFAVSEAGRPTFWGENPSLNLPKCNPGDNFTTGCWGASVKLSSNDNDTIWSATTTSRALVRNMAFKKGSGDALVKPAVACANDGQAGSTPDFNNKWCTIAKPNVAGVGATVQDASTNNKPYFWFDIADVSTVWREPTTPPPPTAYCQSITVDPTTLSGSGTTPLKATVAYSDGQVYKTEVTWSSQNGKFDIIDQPSFTQNLSSNQPFATTFIATPNTNPSVHVAVTKIEGAANSDNCQKGLDIKLPPLPPVAVCKAIVLTPNSINAPGVNNYSASVIFEGGEPNATYETEVTWSGNNGTYSKPAVQNQQSNTAFTNTFTANAKDSGITVQVTGIKGAQNSFNCANGVSINKPTTPPVCKALTILDKNGLPMPASVAVGTDTSNMSLKVEKEAGATLLYKWNVDNGPGQFSNGQTSVKTPDEKQKVTFNGGADGSQVSAYGVDIHGAVQCYDSFKMTTQPPEGPVCKDSAFSFTLADGSAVPSTLNPGQSYQFKAAGQQTNGLAIESLNWSTNGGTLNTTSSCPVQASGKNLTNIPASCTVNFGGGSKGTVVSVSSFPPENGICQRNVVVVDQPNPPKAVCESITLTPSQLNANGAPTNLNVSIKFSDNADHPGFAQWSGNGSYSQGNLQSFNTKNFGNTFVPNNAQTSAASVQVLGFTDGTGLGNCAGLIKSSTPPNPPGDYCQNINLQPQPNGDICALVSGVYTGNYYWTYNGQTKTVIGNGNKVCLGVPNLPPNSKISLTTDSPNPSCQVPNYTPPVNPPNLQKLVKEVASAKDYSKKVTLAASPESKVVEYKLTFDPKGYPTSATIHDKDIQNNFVQGKTNTGENGGKIEFQSATISPIAQCAAGLAEADKKNCYEGNLNSAAGLKLYKVTSQVVITYRGIVKDSKLTAQVCNDQQSNVCQETYINHAYAEYTVYSPDMQTEMSKGITAPDEQSTVQSYCQYILTRAAGDIFLDSELNFGKDISKCSDYKSGTGVVVTPGQNTTQQLGSTGSSEIFTVGHEICDAGQAGSLDPKLEALYGQGISKSLSSQVCEVKLRQGEGWKKSVIVSTIEENKTRLSRWNPNVQPNTTINSFENSALPASSNGVYHVKGNLTLGNGVSDLRLNDGQGAKTFIIEDGDLTINNNIIYGACAAGQTCTVKQTASLAFIVLNGNVYVNPKVNALSGVFFVQKGENTDNGKFISGSASSPNQESFEPMAIFGSVYGNIEPLFQQRRYAGDPGSNQGSIVIRFDERIILNTPPGIRDVVQVSATEVAR